MKKFIEIRGARTHNLQNIDLDLPIGQMTCLIGPSGSGKSSLATHTLVAESKRRLLNSLPNDVKFFWDIPTSADVDSITPVLPVWHLPQANPVVSARACVLDLLGVSEELEFLFCAFGVSCCPEHKRPFSKKSFRVHSENFDFDESERLQVFLRKEDFIKIYGHQFFPTQVYSEENSAIEPFPGNGGHWEAFKIKAEHLSSILQKMPESFSRMESCPLFIYSAESRVFRELRWDIDSRCSACDRVPSIDRLSRAWLSPFNALGACIHCRGHGMILEYDPKKLVKSPELSIKDGAITLLKYKRFEKFYPLLIKELKKKKISIERPFVELEQEVIWKILFEGMGEYPGFNTLLSYVESKRYMPAVRIFLRGLQSEGFCHECQGARVKAAAGEVAIGEIGGRYVFFKELLSMELQEMFHLLKEMMVDGSDKKYIARLQRILEILNSAISLKLNYLPVLKRVKTLRPSEYQRILLAKILSYKGGGALFVLDEPSVGLSVDEQMALAELLFNLKAQGNTILLVDHSPFIQSQCDYHVEMGPGAGPKGGSISYQGGQRKSSPLQLKKLELKNEHDFLDLSGANFNGLRFKNFRILKRMINCYSGGTQSRVREFILEELFPRILSIVEGKISKIEDISQMGKLEKYDFSDVLVFGDEKGAGNIRSTVGSFLGISPVLRKYFSSLPQSKALGLRDGHFSFNSQLGRCPDCEGKGVKIVDLQFMEDLVFTCESCCGKKLRPYIAKISDGQYSVCEAFSTELSELAVILGRTPKMKRLLRYLKMLNLDYLSPDRSLKTLSGGERQRLRLVAKMLGKIENTLLIFENLSYGLSLTELMPITALLEGLVAQGNTIVIVDEDHSLLGWAHNGQNYGKKGLTEH